MPSKKEIARLFSETYKLNPENVKFLEKMTSKDFESAYYQDILFKVGHQSHAASAGATGTAFLPLWMQGKYAKPLTLFQRIAASVTWDSYINYIKPMKVGNFAPILKAGVGHALSGAALYGMYEWLFDTQPPKADSDTADRIGMYMWRGEFFGVFGDAYGSTVGLSRQSGFINPIMEPVIYRNFKAGAEELFAFMGETKTFNNAINDLAKKTVVLYGQGEKLYKANQNTPGLNYNFVPPGKDDL